jgi:oxygen-independent coproporphyrinogen-3 oxidase
MSGVRHLYVHLPFCSSRCGYCDFVTVVGRRGDHGVYAGAVLTELERRRPDLAESVETVFLGGGTPTFTETPALERVLDGLPACEELTVEANPETVTPAVARVLRDHGVTRVSLGAQTFQPRLLAVLDRQATPDDVRRAVHTLRDANIDNISLDLVYGIPCQCLDDLEADLRAACALEPEHLSCYELEAKPGTRFTHAWGDELRRQAEAMDGYFEHVVDVLTQAGYRWYETANFCRTEPTRDLRAQHNLGYWRGRDYIGVGIGAVSTRGHLRWRNTPSLRRYLAAVSSGADVPCEIERLDETTKDTERLMLGLRLDEPLELAGVAAAVDRGRLAALVHRGLVEWCGADSIRLSHRGRLLGGAVTADLLAA